MILFNPLLIPSLKKYFQNSSFSIFYMRHFNRAKSRPIPLIRIFRHHPHHFQQFPILSIACDRPKFLYLMLPIHQFLIKIDDKIPIPFRIVSAALLMFSISMAPYWCTIIIHVVFRECL